MQKPIPLHLALALAGRLQGIAKRSILILTLHLLKDLLNENIPGRQLALAARHLASSAIHIASGAPLRATSAPTTRHARSIVAAVTVATVTAVTVAVATVIHLFYLGNRKSPHRRFDSA